jgi:hypothetical protein
MYLPGDRAGFYGGRQSSRSGDPVAVVENACNVKKTEALSASTGWVHFVKI